MRLLIVDDNQRMRRLLKTILTDLITDAVEAANGSEAVECYKNFHPDVVLMDIRMNVMDGLEATRRILKADPSARVIIVTDFDTQEYRSEAALAGAKEFILKEDLFKIRERVLTLFPLS